MKAISPDRMQVKDDLLIYVNGKLLPQREALISVYDSGLNFADGVFEGLRVYSGRVFCLDDHIARLFNSAQRFQIEIGMTQAKLKREILEWLRTNQIRDDFHFRPIVTRGNRFPPRMDPRYASGPATILFVGGPIETPPLVGIRVVVSKFRRPPAEVLDPKIKSLSYGNNILAKLEAIDEGADDALMLDMEGLLAEATTSNVFLVKAGRLITPLTKTCLEGITRRAVMRLSTELNRRVEERDVGPDEVLEADEVFLTGTAAELTPVVVVDGKQLGTGEPGPITRELARRYRELVRREGAEIGT